mmetsp:Transcript_15293/g.23030  ORF Transcript_15293/g.23030 Transcript_15293/m.23030 type:complete len:409 (+) Transcript_15293:52-1278(+)
MLKYLQSCKSILRNVGDVKVNIVMGNQACDADSIISSLCYAYLMSCKSTNSNIAYVPAASILRSDVHFRREVQILLQTVNLSLAEIICLEECPLEELSQRGLLALTLADHNDLPPHLHAKYGANVVEIIDHHIDKGHYSWIPSECRNIAFDASTQKASSGSTCTLVAEEYYKVMENVQSSDLLTQDIATLLMGVITLDTINMDPVAGIGTERDSRILCALSEISPHSRDDLFEKLRGAKLDPVFWRELSASDALRMDFKLFSGNCHSEEEGRQLGQGCVGISSVLQPVSAFLNKEGVGDAIRNMIRDFSMDSMVVMSFVHHPQRRREILVCSPSRHYTQSLHEFLCREGNCRFDLTIMNDDQIKAEQLFGMDMSCIVYHQGSTGASRKQLAPDIQLFQDHFYEANSDV